MDSTNTPAPITHLKRAARMTDRVLADLETPDAGTRAAIDLLRVNPGMSQAEATRRGHRAAADAAAAAWQATA